MTNYKLFNDYWFDRAKRYVLNEITITEVNLYNAGLLSKVYSSFEELLFDNIEYYSRILRTILWLYENVLVDDGKVLLRTDKVKYKKPMTPTKFYYICLCNSKMQRSEILYGYHQIANSLGQDFYELWKDLMNVGSFSFNATFSTKKFNTTSYKYAFEQDITSSKYLDKVIVNTSYVYVDKIILSNDIGQLYKLKECMTKTYEVISDFSTEQNVVDVRPIGATYISSLFKEELIYDKNLTRKQSGKIEDTFEFDIRISENAKTLFKNFEVASELLQTLPNMRLIAKSMIQNYRRKFYAIRTTTDERGYAIIQLKKFWNNYRIIESYVCNGVLLSKKTFNCGRIWKVIDYIIRNGYYIYTIDNIETCINLCSLDNPDAILEHYSDYINKTFVDTDIRLEMMEKQTQDIITFLTGVKKNEEND